MTVPKTVYDKSGSHVVRVGSHRYVIVYADERHYQWQTSNAEGGLYVCSGLGDDAFRDVCTYAAQHGTTYRTKQAAVELVDAEIEARS